MHYNKYRYISISEVDGQCIGSTLKIYLKIKESGNILGDTSLYGLSDLLTCQIALTEGASSVATNPRSSLLNSFVVDPTVSCFHESSSGSTLAPLQLGSLDTRDLLGTVGFEIS